MIILSALQTKNENKIIYISRHKAKSNTLTNTFWTVPSMYEGCLKSKLTYDFRYNKIF